MSLGDCYKITDNRLQQLVKLTLLNQLCTDNGLQHLLKFPSLLQLDLRECYKITATRLQHLMKITSLQSLRLSSCTCINDNVLQQLKQFRISSHGDWISQS